MIYGQPRARRTPGYGLETRSAIGIGIEAETERSDATLRFGLFL